MKKRIVLFALAVTCACAASAQTMLQRCIGVVPGHEPTHQLGPSPATMSYCQQLPGWSLYQAAGQRYQAGDHAGAAQLALQAAQAGNGLAQVRLAMMYDRGDGVLLNRAAALYWKRAAAAQGEPAAEDMLVRKEAAANEAARRRLGR
jgi:TPR repeat protein